MNNKVLIAQVAPAVRVAIGEPFGCKQVKPKQIVTSLKKLGFDFVFDTTFSADVTIMEEGTELLHRYEENKLPMFTSCCPGWISLVEASYPELKSNISSTKSPQQIMGALVKNYFAEKINKHPSDIFHVSIMPCVRKQAEADRPNINTHDDVKDVDLVITTNNLVDWIKEEQIDFCNIDETPFDNPMGEASGGGVIFGRSGGVMLAAIRFASQNKLKDVEFTPNEIISSVKEAHLEFEVSNKLIKLDIAVIIGLADAKKYVAAMKQGKMNHHFIEVMACVPVGCASGGGQPNVGKNKEILQTRKDAINKIDHNTENKACHENDYIKKLYDDYLSESKAHDLLHN